MKIYKTKWYLVEVFTRHYQVLTHLGSFKTRTEAMARLDQVSERPDGPMVTVRRPEFKDGRYLAIRGSRILAWPQGYRTEK